MRNQSTNRISNWNTTNIPQRKLHAPKIEDMIEAEVTHSVNEDLGAILAKGMTEMISRR